MKKQYIQPELVSQTINAQNNLCIVVGSISTKGGPSLNYGGGNDGSSSGIEPY